MSEHQYYEFQTIDRPLSTSEQAEIKKLSSRVQLTPTQAIFVYNFGDFRGKPEQILTQYFDAMFYIANWGTWQLMFRFPKAIIDPSWFVPYDLPNAITVTTTPKYIVLDIQIIEEDGFGWVEGEGWLPELLPLRNDLLSGDLRLLYLVWLRVAPYLAGEELDDDPIEPPIPPNLSQLSPPLEAFIKLVELNPDLVDAAAQASTRHQASSDLPLENWLSALSEAEKQKFLLKLLQREPHTDLQLINRLKELAGAGRSSPPFTPGQRRLSELEAIVDTLRAKREQKEQNAAKKKRIKELEALAPQEAEAWQRVGQLIEFKQAKPYDEAAALLKDLLDLADYQGRLPEFDRRFEKLKSDYSNRPALIARLRKIRS
ncbi:hypothetical protein [Pseudanabaena sp. PCC 6802]|uniref:hypothetical protein n=1 Tax=Pseudanabaena sp. PCC 6802 TaxID=118173 RepID=UPI0003490A50|nr:hypothetical protein [Pseudanabaena sp. PCC 6802]